MKKVLYYLVISFTFVFASDAMSFRELTELVSQFKYNSCVGSRKPLLLIYNLFLEI